MALYKPVETIYGFLFGRDAIFLDRYSAKDNGDLVLEGEINCTLASNPPDGKWCPYELRFQGVTVVQITELDTYDCRQAKSDRPETSFDEVFECDWKESLISKNSRVTNDSRVFVVQTYDWVFEVICKDFRILFGDPRHAS